MKHYMLAVHMTEGTPIPSEEEIQQAYRDTDAFNAEIQAAGSRRVSSAEVRGHHE